MIKGNEFQGDLEVGTRVHCILYGGQDGIIFKVNGTQSPGSIRQLGGGCVVAGGGAFFDVVFKDGAISHAIPEAIIRGVQWFIQKDNKATPEEIQFALAYAVLETSRKKREEESAEKERTIRKKSLRESHPELKPIDPNTYDSLKKGSRNLKIELKSAFPKTKFSVRAESFSGGCAIDVHWVDGPPTETVEEISSKYQEGHFNGMTDLYENNRNNVWTDIFGGAKFVSCKRKYSKESYLQAVSAIEREYDVKIRVSYTSSGTPYISNNDDANISERDAYLQYASNAVNQKLSKTTY